MQQVLNVEKWAVKRGRFFRFCIRCGDKFKPKGKYSNVCNTCFINAQKNKYKNKKELKKIN